MTSLMIQIKSCGCFISYTGDRDHLKESAERGREKGGVRREKGGGKRGKGEREKGERGGRWEKRGMEKGTPCTPSIMLIHIL